jgi:hypothetical protein
MTGLRLVLVVVAAMGLCVGCAVGGPERASDIQNLHGISDDISAVSMTQSDGLRAHDPNIPTTLPRSYEDVQEEDTGSLPLP